ncbi:MAG: hypothetical protein ABFS14_08325 [Gemmatimonadota bacterium]
MIGTYRTLLSPKLLTIKQRSRGGGSRTARRLLIGALGLLVGYGLYWGITRLLEILLMVEDLGPLLASKILSIGLLAMLGILLLSSLIAALSSFFLARDLPAIRSAPVDWLAVYFARLTETLVSSSWMVLLLMLPLLIAYEQVFEGGIGFYAVSASALIPFFLIPAVVGSAVTLLLVRVFPAARSRDILTFVSIATVGLLVLGLRLLRPERLVNPDASRELVDYLAVLRGPSSPWLSSQWTADAMTGYLEGGFDPFWLLLLWSTAAGLVVLGALLHWRMFSLCFTKAQEGADQRVRRHAGWRAYETLLSPLPLRRRELILKDTRTFFRDTTQWSQLILLAVLVVVYVYNIRVLPIRSNEVLQRWLVSIVFFLNLALSGFVLAAIAARFVFPSYSLEGRTLWLLGSSPVQTSTLMWSKFWIGAAPLTVLAVALAWVTNAFLGVETGFLVLALVTTAALSLAFASQALAWGVFFPQFEAENAAQIPTSVGGLLFMLGAVGNLILVILVQYLPLRRHVWSGFTGGEATQAVGWELGTALVLTLAVCGLTTLVPYVVASRRLDA